MCEKPLLPRLLLPPIFQPPDLCLWVSFIPRRPPVSSEKTAVKGRCWVCPCEQLSARVYSLMSVWMSNSLTPKPILSCSHFCLCITTVVILLQTLHWDGLYQKDQGCKLLQKCKIYNLLTYFFLLTYIYHEFVISTVNVDAQHNIFFVITWVHCL